MNGMMICFWLAVKDYFDFFDFTTNGYGEHAGLSEKFNFTTKIFVDLCNEREGRKVKKNIDRLWVRM